jgi:hypothetical protein
MTGEQLVRNAKARDIRVCRLGTPHIFTNDLTEIKKIFTLYIWPTG